jgi:hypothetical protein
MTLWNQYHFYVQTGTERTYGGESLPQVQIRGVC